MLLCTRTYVNVNVVIRQLTGFLMFSFNEAGNVVCGLFIR